MLSGRCAPFFRASRIPPEKSQSPCRRLCVPPAEGPPLLGLHGPPSHAASSEPRAAHPQALVSSRFPPESSECFLSLGLEQCLAWQRSSSGVYGVDWMGEQGAPFQICPASITKRVSLLHPYLKDFLGSPGSGNKTYLFSLILRSPALSLRFCHFLLPSAPTARNSCLLSIPLLCLPATALDFSVVCFKAFICFKITSKGTSLVVQWLRICLPMQGTQVRSLVRGDSTCRGATKPMRCNYRSLQRPRACALKLEKPLQ